MEEVFLTEEQKQNVLQEWNARPDNPPSLLELIKVAGFENKDDKDVAKSMGYITSEKNRLPGYKQIKNIKKRIITKAKKILDSL